MTMIPLARWMVRGHHFLPELVEKQEDQEG